LGQLNIADPKQDGGRGCSHTYQKSPMGSNFGADFRKMEHPRDLKSSLVTMFVSRSIDRKVSFWFNSIQSLPNKFLSFFGGGGMCSKCNMINDIHDHPAR